MLLLFFHSREITVSGLFSTPTERFTFLRSDGLLLASLILFKQNGINGFKVAQIIVPSAT